MEIERTMSIPYVVGRDNQVFGFLIHPSSKEGYLVRLIAFPPSAVEMIGGRAKGMPEEAASKGIEVERGVWGDSTLEIWLDPGDPKGAYRAELFINGKLASTADFTVGP